MPVNTAYQSPGVFITVYNVLYGWEVCVNTPQQNGRQAESRPTQETRFGDFWIFGSISFILTILAGFWLYSELIEITTSFHFFSTTALTVLHFSFWIGLWILLLLIRGQID